MVSNEAGRRTDDRRRLRDGGNSTLLGTVNLKGVGVTNVSRSRPGTGEERLHAEMYVESMTFDLAGLA